MLREIIFIRYLLSINIPYNKNTNRVPPAIPKSASANLNSPFAKLKSIIIGPLAALVCSSVIVEAAADNLTSESDFESVVVIGVKYPVADKEYQSPLLMFSDDNMQLEYPTNVSELAAKVPGLNVLDSGSRNPTILIVRGLHFNGVDSNDLGGDGGTVATYVNNLSMQGYYTPPQFSLKDIRSVEVLKGQQANLYGATSLSGLIRYETQQPLLNQTSVQFHTRNAHTSESNDINSDTDLVANFNLVDNTLAMRVMVGYQDVAGFIDNDYLLDGFQEDTNDEVNIQSRVSLLYQPTERFRASFFAHSQEGHVDDRQASNIALTNNAYTASNRYLQTLDGQLDISSIEVQYNFDSTTLLVTSGLYQYQENQVTDETDFYLWLDTAYEGALEFNSYDGFTSYRSGDSEVDQKSVELRLFSDPENSFSWIAGLYYAKNKYQGVVNDYTPGFFANYLGMETTDDIDTHNTQNETLRDRTLFGELTMDLLDRWQLSLGSRSYDYGDNIAVCSSFPNYSPQVNCFNQDKDERGSLFSISSLVRLTSDNVMYFNVNEGFRRGGANFAPSADESSQTYDPDTAINYELGFSGSSPNKPAQYKAVFFYMDWSDIQVSTINDLGYTMWANANDAASQGVELEITLLLSSRLSLVSSYSYTEAQLTEDALDYNGSGDNGFENDRLPGSPRNQAYASFLYDTQIASYRLKANVNGHYIGSLKSDLNENHSDFRLLGGYSLFNASVALMQNRWRAGLYMSNITNKRSVIGFRGQSIYGTQGGFEYINRPRTTGFDFQYSL